MADAQEGEKKQCILFPFHGLTLLGKTMSHHAGTRLEAGWAGTQGGLGTQGTASSGGERGVSGSERGGVLEIT